MIIECNSIGCDHNTGFTKECMFDVNQRLIEAATSNEPMCPILKERVLQMLNQTSIQSTFKNTP